jgi:hypothetical protein
MGCCTGAKSTNNMNVKFQYEATGKKKTSLEFIMASTEVIRTPNNNEVKKDGKEVSGSSKKSS